MTHTLKIFPDFWDAVTRGDKTFEVRRDDRGFSVGDMLELIRMGEPTAARRRLTYAITYILPGGQYGIEPGYVVLGLRTAVGPKAALAETPAASLHAIGAEALRDAANLIRQTTPTPYGGDIDPRSVAEWNGRMRAIEQINERADRLDGAGKGGAMTNSGVTVLEAQLTEARKDAARWSYLRANITTHEIVRRGAKRPKYAFKPTHSSSDYDLFGSIDDAIDAEMAQKP